MEYKTFAPYRNTLLKIAILAVTGTVVALGIFHLSTSRNVHNARSDTNAELELIQSKLINSLVLPPDYKRIPDFSLTDATGNSVTAELFSDQWSLVFFGYMNCPDICPLTLATVKNATNTLALSDETQPQVVFVSVDPTRDKPQHLKSYLKHFDEGFVGITGDIEPLSKWVTAMGMSFVRHDEVDKTSYSVDHSSSILLIDPEQRIRGVFNAPLEVDTIVNDYGLIVNALRDILI